MNIYIYIYLLITTFLQNKNHIFDIIQMNYTPKIFLHLTNIILSKKSREYFFSLCSVEPGP